MKHKKNVFWKRLKWILINFRFIVVRSRFEFQDWYLRIDRRLKSRSKPEIIRCLGRKIIDWSILPIVTTES